MTDSKTNGEVCANASKSSWGNNMLTGEGLGPFLDPSTWVALKETNLSMFSIQNSLGKKITKGCSETRYL